MDGALWFTCCPFHTLFGSAKCKALCDGGTDLRFDDLILQGVAYAVGLTLAMRLWRPLLHRKLAKRLARTMHMY